MAASRPTADARGVRRALAMVAVAGLVAAAVLFAVTREEVPAGGPTVDEKIAILRTASLQARADSEARLDGLPAFRTAGLLLDALLVRSDSDGDRAFDRLPAFRRHAFGELDVLNGALKDALDTPSEGARLAAHKAAARAATQFDWLVADDAPLILSYSPRFVPPRRATGELTLAPNLRMSRLVPRRGRAAARHTGRTGGQPGGAGAAALRAGFRRGRRRRSAAADRDRRVASGICRRATGAVDRCVAGAGTVSPERLRFRCRARPS